MESHFLDIILVVFFTALIVTVLFRQLRLPVILGYLIVGAMMGPTGLGIVPKLPIITNLAEFGIVFLMFTVGLEFSLPKLYALRYLVFFVGGLQVIFTILITTICGIFFGMTAITALIVGSIVAMSSTALVIKQLNDQLELQSQHGLNAIGILLFQDLAVIPIFILIASFAENSTQPFVIILLWALFKGIVAILLIFAMGRWLLKPLFHLIAKTRAVELFTLTVLLVTLSAAWITNTLGLSYALGAFLAGIMLAETEFRHQIEVEIRPFRDILLGLFFITIGMLADMHTWYETSYWILLLVSALVIGKMVLIFLITRLFGNTFYSSLRTGLVLAQGSEFGFAILTIALSNQVLPAAYGQVILAALLISIVISPIIIFYNGPVARFLLPKPISHNNQQEVQKILLSSKKHKPRIIICGYGRVGQHIVRLLEKVHIPYLALDLNSELIQLASLAGENVMYGDPTHPGILKAAGIQYAKVLVISFNDIRIAEKIISTVKQSHPNLPILVRCRDEAELKQLKTSGATQVIAELFEESLTLSHHLLNLIRIPADKISDLIHDIRSKDYELLYKVFAGEESDVSSLDISLHEELRPILVYENAYCIGKKIKELKFHHYNVEVIAMRRENTKRFKPRSITKIHENDILIVFGTIENLDDVEQYLLEGSRK